MDRGALDAALVTGTTADGWCPEGRIAEDGHISERYPLGELPGADYAARTRRNVIDTDATVIIYFGRVENSPGTQLTLEQCIVQNKPYLLLNAEIDSETDSVQKIQEFISAHNATRLNIAGPRAQQATGAYQYCYAVLLRVLSY